ncbi:hypothetical protein L1887_16239 [Cichorium endivia]|nr:hypothetical protein L1887_16239 [Cichorium endivia]
MLSKLRHSHIVSLLGYHEASDKREMILNRPSPYDQKHIGRTIFFEKAWSLFMIKTPKDRMSSPIEKLGQSINNKNESILMEKHATTVVEGGCESGGIATASQQVVLLLPTGQTKIPNLKLIFINQKGGKAESEPMRMTTGEVKKDRFGEFSSPIGTILICAATADASAGGSPSRHSN